MEFDGDGQQAALHNRLSGDETGLRAQQQIYIPSAWLSLSARLTLAFMLIHVTKHAAHFHGQPLDRWSTRFDTCFAVCSETGK